MALSYKKPPDGLLEIFERIYVFDCCFSTDALEQEDYKVYMSNIISQFKDHFPESSIKIFNFREGDTASRVASISSEYDITTMDYPRHYEGCPLLSLEVIHHFLKSSETWLSLGQQNVLLMHSEVGGWPVLAFMMAALLLYRKHCTGEFKTLDLVHKQAPRRDVLRVMSPLDPVPSQLRYLHYVSRRTAETEWWPPADKALTLDYVLIRMIPDFDGKGGCCPIIRIYGRDPLSQVDKTPKLLFSTPRRSNNLRYYNQAEGEPVKIDINCHIQGDIVLECISLHDDTGTEKLMYRAVFNTTFIKSNMLMFNRDEIDLRWDAKDQFPKDFSTELQFSEMDAAASMVPVDSSCFMEDVLPKEALAKLQEVFSSVDYVVPKNNAAFNRLHEMALSDIIREVLDHQMTETSNLFQKLPKRDQDKESITSSNSKLKRSGTESDIFKADGQLQASLPGCTKSISMPPHMNFTCSVPSLSKGPSVSTSSPPPPTSKGTTVVKSQSTKKLKPLCWLKLKKVPQGSLWDEAQKSGEAARVSDIDMSELERLFSEATPNSKKAKAKSRAAIKPEGVQLIEHIREYDCETMLSKLKIPVAEIMDHVLALDDSAMDVDQVENLIKFCPTQEEMEMIKGYKGDLDKLGKREQFFLELMRVPRSEAKLRIFSYKLQFNTRVSDLRKILNDVCLSIEEMRSSVKLRRVMLTILSLGNALNQGTARGAAVGFRLDSLLNLIETRAENKNMTLMHYLCKVLAEKQPELLDFSKELGSLESVSKIQLKDAAEKMLTITTGLEKVVHEKKLCKKDGHVSKRFRKLLRKFLAFAEGEVRSLASLYSGLGKKVDGLICYFGEDPAKFPYGQAVSTLLVFVRMFNQAHEENCKQIEAEKQKKHKGQKESEKEKKEAKHESLRPQKEAEKEKKEGEKEKLKLQKHSNMESESLRSSNKSSIALDCISLHEKSSEAASRASELEHLLSAPHLNSDKAKAKSLEEDKTKKDQLILHGKPYETDNKPRVASRVCCSLFWPLIPCGWWWQRWLDSSPYGDL